MVELQPSKLAMRVRVLGGVTVEVGDCYRKNPLGTDAGTAGSVVAKK